MALAREFQYSLRHYYYSCRRRFVDLVTVSRQAASDAQVKRLLNPRGREVGGDIET